MLENRISNIINSVFLNLQNNVIKTYEAQDAYLPMYKKVELDAKKQGKYDLLIEAIKLFTEMHRIAIDEGVGYSMFFNENNFTKFDCYLKREEELFDVLQQLNDYKKFNLKFYLYVLYAGAYNYYSSMDYEECQKQLMDITTAVGDEISQEIGFSKKPVNA